MSHRKWIVLIELSALSTLVACSQAGQDIRAVGLPSYVQSAELHIQGDVGTLRVDYPGSVVVVDGTIRRSFGTQDFVLTTHSAVRGIALYEFFWRPAQNGWYCPVCLQTDPTGLSRDSFVIWMEQ